MGTIKTHPPVKYFCAVTYLATFELHPLYQKLASIFSSIEMKSNSYDFSQFTDYYNHEMGEKLNKIFLVFSDLGPPEQLPELKIKTNKIEHDYVKGTKRQVNIDPGYVTQAKVVLATTKNYTHRIFLAQGIFADLHLQFFQGSFHKQPWTYPDYQQEEVISFFNYVRKRYFEQLGEMAQL
jgi:hypothetical protein